MRATEKILKAKIKAIETALETNDVEFIGKWHGNRDSAAKDLAELKERLNTFKNEKIEGETTNDTKIQSMGQRK